MSKITYINYGGSMKIWAKLLVDDKNVKDAIIENKMAMTFANYEELLRNIADVLDIPTPLTMKIHFNHFKQFNTHKFNEKDFVESIDFDYLEIENV